MNKGHFTLPGESGYEELTLKLAQKWGADVIRDSDGTELSEDILNAGFDIYSTICIIRGHNEWANAHPEQIQQTFLMTEPVTAISDSLSINLMEGFFDEQFKVNDSTESLSYWQVFDRTSNTGLPNDCWYYRDGTVVIKNTIPWHSYTVSFIAYRIWEEISMYNHVTNSWESEHLIPIDPMYPETAQYLLKWLEDWCISHPHTNVVRLTSLFYNFVWIWGNDERHQNLFTDWASYDFTVSTKALELFEKEYGYRMTAEDFINKGKLHCTHCIPTKQKLDWMNFINKFVVDFGRKLTDIIHSHGKKAYVFYDDSWVGLEPNKDNFTEFNFDGLIKCVFSGFEARLCANADVPIHELRLHPYLFPVGLGGLPTFKEGGNPTLDAKMYWLNLRRALLRVKIDRIGLGGYLHLTESFPDFCDYIENLADEFRTIRELHLKGKPAILPIKIAILTAWGKLRAWTCSGHFHETYTQDLINILESLSGLPLDIDFICFDDIDKDITKYDIIINAGSKHSAWSGDTIWENTKFVERLNEWVFNGGVFLAVNEASMVDGFNTSLRMSNVLGIDIDNGEKICHGKISISNTLSDGLIPDGSYIAPKKEVFLTDISTKVYMSENQLPTFTVHRFGNGYGVYLSSFKHSIENTRLLFNIILKMTDTKQSFIPDNIYTEAAYFPESKKLVLINNSDKPQSTQIDTPDGLINAALDAFETKFIDL